MIFLISPFFFPGLRIHQRPASSARQKTIRLAGYMLVLGPPADKNCVLRLHVVLTNFFPPSSSSHGLTPLSPSFPSPEHPA
ncbi:Protein of unknown function [Pyronema omphalodes CBS 100304]|uniref:Uncharacterized protein n=1 Tax=Pyronema omphalodes (strain CBS 100304) TaxID=1076935 RepID=U4LJ95_PYROM|nr:Protein of unknown function [Pyronema omphalodes CBS 100304]